MDSLPARAQDDNTNSVKSDDSSPRHDPGRGSPPPNCAICLGTCRNKSFTDSCLHQFCFKCLLTWSKVKAECPLCKQNFRSIIHNVRSNHQYEEYLVVQHHTEELSDRIDIDSLNSTRRFRYRTTLTLPRQETLAIQQLLLHHYPMVAQLFPGPLAPRRRSPASFRRTVYRYNLWARPLPDFTRRFRDCSPDFYRHNTSQMHRLVPWLNRELHYLLNENVGHIAYVVARILELLPQFSINSTEFREALRRYFGDNTDHFLHELYCFASTPYDMNGYDRNVQYTTDNTISTMVNEVLSSSESEASVDSDIVMISSSEPTDPPPGPSRVPAPVYPQSYITQPAADSVIPIETISQSDSDDDSSEVMVVGYIKPPQDRTPEVVDLLGSDSDVIVQENGPPEPETHDLSENLPPSLVKLTLKRHDTRAASVSDSDESAYTPSLTPPPRKRRYRSNDTATTADTSRTTPSPPAPFGSSAFHSPTSSSSTTSSNDTSYDSDTSSDSLLRNHSDRVKKIPRRKLAAEKSKSRTKMRSSRMHRKSKKDLNYSPGKEQQSKHKSHSGKGVKSSNKCIEMDTAMAEPERAQQALDQPGTSGTARVTKLRPDRSTRRRRLSRESKRLKSVVNVIRSQNNSELASKESGDRPRENTDRESNEMEVEYSQPVPDAEYSDSEDDLPLNLSIMKGSRK
ncbi:E3 ubiquitin-protein ligase Topors [Pararge aegeria]|uniref:E3 ubiquitin-protein ligase Topors n=1 Tax=Pararge aegeria TaxID=116150 RepID=UPI0019D2BF65|nr:E3 ubiquitin-protein ligase Topors [Pararge aegeria]XP_039757125.1 E3 ubiquitin-protein ligase Topors [Pararge aegeria]